MEISYQKQAGLRFYQHWRHMMSVNWRHSSNQDATYVILYAYHCCIHGHATIRFDQHGQHITKCEKEDLQKHNKSQSKQFQTGYIPHFLVGWPSMSGVWCHKKHYVLQCMHKIPQASWSVRMVCNMNPHLIFHNNYSSGCCLDPHLLCMSQLGFKNWFIFYFWSPVFVTGPK